MNQRNMDKSDATPAVSDRVSVAELKHSPLAVNALRDLNVPRHRLTSNPCHRGVDRIRSRPTQEPPDAA
jgi:hypothetical protein